MRFGVLLAAVLMVGCGAARPAHQPFQVIPAPEDPVAPGEPPEVEPNAPALVHCSVASGLTGFDQASQESREVLFCLWSDQSVTWQFGEVVK